MARAETLYHAENLQCELGTPCKYICLCEKVDDASPETCSRQLTNGKQCNKILEQSIIKQATETSHKYKPWGQKVTFSNLKVYSYDSPQDDYKNSYKAECLGENNSFVLAPKGTGQASKGEGMPK